MKLLIAVALLSVSTWAQFPVLPGVLAGGSAGTIVSINTYPTTCSSGTTCTVTATNGITAGDTVLIAASSVSQSIISSTSIDGAGSKDTAIRAAWASNRRQSYAYLIQNASAVSMGGTFTVNFPISNGGGNLYVVDITTAGGTLAIDAVNDLSNGSNGPTLSACSWATMVVTCTLSSTNTIISGQSYSITGVTPSGYNVTSIPITVSSSI